MPVVVIPTCFIDPVESAPRYTECRVVNRVLPAILQELFQYHPALFNRFKDADGRPRANWFGLIRELDGEDLRFIEDVVLDEEERLHLLNMIGC